MDEKEIYIKDLYDDLRYSVSKFDAQTLAISSGALGLSLTFIKDIVPFSDAKYTSLFLIAIILFVISIIGGFIGHYLSIKQISNSIDKANNNRLDLITQDKFIPKLNFIIMLTLVVGISILVLYCILNIIEIQNVPQIKK